jgi:hypothetical protein
MALEMGLEPRTAWSIFRCARNWRALNLQCHHHQPTPLVLQELGTERRRPKVHQSVSSPEPLTKAQHHDLAMMWWNNTSPVTASEGKLEATQ